MSITTNSLIKTLQFNPSFDVVTDLYQSAPLIEECLAFAGCDPGTFTGCLLPLRMHAETRDKIAHVVYRLQPDIPQVYFGAIVAEKAVVSLIKSDAQIAIIPSGKRHD